MKAISKLPKHTRTESTTGVLNTICGQYTRLKIASFQNTRMKKAKARSKP